MKAVKVQARLDKLFKPRTVAVIGASQQTGTVGYAILNNLLNGGFRGTVYPVNPKYAGTALKHQEKTLTFLSSAADLPDGVDLAILMTPSHTIPDILETLGQKQVVAVVVITAGFVEVGTRGEELAQQAAEVVNRYNMVMVGPNCLGIANTEPSVLLNATFAQNIPPHGHGAMFSQSGAVGIDVMERARRIGLGLAQFASLGNELQLGPMQLLDYWRTAEDICYVMGYMESGQSLANLRDIAPTVTRRQPVLLVKSGRSIVGARAACSHTGSLAGNDAAVTALCRQIGIQRFETIAELFAAAQAFENAHPAVGHRVAIFSNAGGYAVMASDMLDPRTGKHHPLTMARFSEETLRQLGRLLPENASVQNPIDTTATFPMDHRENFQTAIRTILHDPGVDACMVILVHLAGMPVEELVGLVAAIQTQIEKPVVMVLTLGEPDLGRLYLNTKSAGLPPLALYGSLDEALTGLEALEVQRRWQQRPVDEPERFIDTENGRVAEILKQVQAEGRTLLTTAESLTVLQAYGIHASAFYVVQTLSQAIQAANTLGYPLAIKLNSKTVTHKTEVGGVKVDIRTEAELVSAYEGMMANLRHFGVHHFEAGEGIMVQSYVSRGREIILGASEDPQFGHLLVVGRGGIYTQVDQDFQLRLSGLTRLDARDMITGIKAYEILKGYRGKPGVHLPAIEDAILRINQLVMDFPQIRELDINPFLACSLQEGPSSAVDARVII